MLSTWLTKLKELTNQLKRKVALNLSAPTILIGLGLILMSVSSLHWLLRYRALSLDEELVAAHAQSLSQTEGKMRSEPVELQIGELFSITIEPGVKNGSHWTVSENKANHLTQSTVPGEAGNIIIYGHNKWNILGKLTQVRIDQEITLQTEDNQAHVYQVMSVDEVDPAEDVYLRPTEDEVLTIYTCTGWLDSKRFVVRAKPK